MELGYVLQPETSGTLVGPLELWMREPHAQLDGQSPMQALARHDGEKLVRACIAELVQPVRPTGSSQQDSTTSDESKVRSGL